jgi:hypothetical protein
LIGVPKSRKRPEPLRNCVTVRQRAYSFGTQVAIEAGLVGGGFTGGAFHQVRLRLQV